jgi:hypothetical protein
MIQTHTWGYSSVGRAPALQAGGQEFESLYLHHLYLENCIISERRRKYLGFELQKEEKKQRREPSRRTMVKLLRA